MARKPRANKIATRTPEVATRDPERVEKQTRMPRHYIQASMPVVCPDCGHSTRMANGRHIDPVNRHILEYRTCCHCDKKLAAGRMMTAREAERFCEYADAVAEYDASK